MRVRCCLDGEIVSKIGPIESSTHLAGCLTDAGLIVQMERSGPFFGNGLNLCEIKRKLFRHGKKCIELSRRNRVRNA